MKFDYSGQNRNQVWYHIDPQKTPVTEQIHKKIILLKTREIALYWKVSML